MSSCRPEAASPPHPPVPPEEVPARQSQQLDVKRPRPSERRLHGREEETPAVWRQLALVDLREDLPQAAVAGQGSDAVAERYGRRRAEEEHVHGRQWLYRKAR